MGSRNMYTGIKVAFFMGFLHELYMWYKHIHKDKDLFKSLQRHYANNNPSQGVAPEIPEFHNRRLSSGFYGDDTHDFVPKIDKRSPYDHVVKIIKY
jgi:hypothetical protein